MSEVIRKNMNPSVILIEKKKWSKYIKGLETLLQDIEKRTKKRTKFILSFSDMSELWEYIDDVYYKDIVRHSLTLPNTKNKIEYKFADDFEFEMALISYELSAVEEFTKKETITNGAKKVITYEWSNYNFFKFHFFIKRIRNTSIKIILKDS